MNLAPTHLSSLSASRIYVRRSLFNAEFASSKTKHSMRSIEISPMLKEALRRHKQTTPKNELNLIFPNEKGGIFKSEYLTKTLFQATLLKAGLKPVCF